MRPVFLLASCLMVVSLAAAQPVPATVDQALDAAREAAVESNQREVMVQVAIAADEHQPDRALADYQAAAEMQPPVSPTARLQADRLMVRGLARLGDPDTARTVLEETLTPLVEKALVSQVEGQPPREPSDNTRQTRVEMLCGYADLLYPLNADVASQAMARAQVYLDQIEDANQKSRALQTFLRALAHTDPGGAWDRWQAEVKDMPAPGPMVLNMIAADPQAVLARLDQINEPRKVGRVYGVGLDQAQAALVATILRQDATQGMDVALRCKLEQAPTSTSGSDPLVPVAQAIVEVGVAALPTDAKYEKTYLRLVRTLPLVGYESAVQLAESLGTPKAQCDALGYICSALAGQRTVSEGDLANARDAARRAMALDGVPGMTRTLALQRAAYALNDHDIDVVPELLKQITAMWAVAGPFGGWWREFREEAEALLPTLSAGQRLACQASMLSYGRDILTDDEKLALAEQALQSPALGRDGDTDARLLREAARFDPDLARTVWQKLPPLDVPQAKDEVIYDRLRGLLAVAEAFEVRERATSGPEVAEVEGVIAAAPAGATWTYLQRARLADIYAYYDGPLCKQTADAVIASLASKPKGVPTDRVLTEAIAVLSRVDMRGTKALVEQREDLRRNTRLFGDLTTTIARRRPQFACEMIFDLVSNEHQARGMARQVLDRIARDADAENVGIFIDTWVARDNRPGEVLTQLPSPLLRSLRPEVVALLPGYLEPMDDADLGMAMGWHSSVALVFASDELLAMVLARMEQSTVRLNQIMAARRHVTAAMAERDWEGAQEALVALPPDERAEALLLIPAMIDYKEHFPDSIRGY